MKKLVLAGLMILALAALSVGCSTTQEKGSESNMFRQTAIVGQPRNIKEAIQQQIQRDQKAFQNCYNPALAEQRNLKGKVIVEWEIGQGGVVESAQIISSDLNNEKVESCLVDVIKNTRFKRVSLASVRYPFVFTTKAN